MKHLEEFLLPDPLPAGTTLWRGTVIQVDPLLIERVEGVMPLTPENYAGPLGVGDRVFGITVNTRPAVIGNASPISILADGSGTFSGSIGAGATATTSVSFESPIPVRRVMVTNTGSNRLILRVLTWSVTTTGFDVEARNVSNGGTSDGAFWWIAIG